MSSVTKYARVKAGNGRTDENTTRKKSGRTAKNEVREYTARNV
jgi:hypothetical protein